MEATRRPGFRAVQHRVEDTGPMAEPVAHLGFRLLVVETDVAAAWGSGEAPATGPGLLCRGLAKGAISCSWDSKEDTEFFKKLTNDSCDLLSAPCV